MKVKVRMVGLDATVIVEGRDLVSLKLLEADMTVTMKPASSPGQRQGMKVRVRIEDISLRDLQVRSRPLFRNLDTSRFRVPILQRGTEAPQVMCHVPRLLRQGCCS